MYEAADLRRGLKIEIEGEPHIIVDFDFVKPGKGQSLYKCRLRNLITGSQFDRTYRSGDRFVPASMDEQEMEFLYKEEGGHYCFMNTSTYEQIHMEEKQVGSAKNYLINNLVVNVVLFRDRPIDINLPIFVDLKVVRAEPGMRGDTASGASKPVTLETGYVIQVPLFVEDGETLRIDTRTGQYVSRVK
jgi:elongation factor P